MVTLDRPEVRNAVDAATAAALYRAFVAFDADGEARVAVFHGANGHFCAGWDLLAGARMAAGPDPAAPCATWTSRLRARSRRMPRQRRGRRAPWAHRGCC